VSGVAIAGGLLYLAEVERRSATSIEFARQAMSLADSEPGLGAERALEALSHAPTKAATTALRVNLAKLPIRVVKIAEGYNLSSPAGIAFAPDGQRVVIAESKAKARLIDVKTGREEFEIAGNGSPMVNAHWSPNGALLAAIDKNGTSFIYETATGKRLAVMDGELHWRATKGENGVSAVVLFDHNVQVVELDQFRNWKTLREVTPLGYKGPKDKPFESFYRELSPDGRRIATLVVEGQRGQVIITDLDSGQASRTELALESPGGLAWSPQGNLIVAKSLNGFAIVDTATAQVSFAEDTRNEISLEDVSFSPDDKDLRVELCLPQYCRYPLVQLTFGVWGQSRNGIRELPHTQDQAIKRVQRLGFHGLERTIT